MRSCAPAWSRWIRKNLSGFRRILRLCALAVRDHCGYLFFYNGKCVHRGKVVCFPKNAVGRQHRTLGLLKPSTTMTSRYPSDGLAFGQNLKPPPSYFLIHDCSKIYFGKLLHVVIVHDKCHRRRSSGKEAVSMRQKDRPAFRVRYG